MKAYIRCINRKGNPKISVEVCARTCRRSKKCMEFYIFKYPPLIPELAEIRISSTAGSPRYTLWIDPQYFLEVLMNIKRREFIIGSGSLVLMASMPGITGFGNLKRSDLKDDSSQSIAKLLSPDEIEILKLASLSPSGHNTQPWTIRIIEPYRWMLGSSKQRWLPGVDPENRELLLSIGAFLKTLEIAAKAKGYDISIEILSIDPKDISIAEISLKKSKAVPFPLEKIRTRRTIRSNILNTKISASDLSFITSGNNDVFLFYPKGSKGASYLEDATIEANRTQSYRKVQWLNCHTG